MLSNYQEKLSEINAKMTDLAGQIEKGESLAFEGFKAKDMSKLDEARDAIKGVRAKATEVDNEIIKALALYGPEATELREMVGYLKITNELVNTAGSIRSYVKHNKAIIASEIPIEGMEASFIALHQSALNAVTAMVKMFDLSRGEEEIRAFYRTIKVEESKGDDLYSIVQKDIAETLCHIDIDPFDYITILKLARKLEHISDHAINVGKLLLFIKTGGEMEIF